MAAIEDIYPKIGIKIEELRKKRKMPQDALAGVLGVTRAAVSSMERGRQRIMAHQLISVARALEVDFVELIPEDERFSKAAPAQALKQELSRKLKDIASEASIRVIVDRIHKSPSKGGAE